MSESTPAGLPNVTTSTTAPGGDVKGDVETTTPPGGAGPPATGPGDPGDAAPRYRPLRYHAGGGLGEVYVAADAELRREVALKRIRAARADDADNRRRFLLEAEITARLEHPGVVPVYGLVADTDGQPCYAMRFIQGQTLGEALEHFHRPPASGAQPAGFDALAFRQLLQRFVAVCNTIAYAHSRGVLHRDLKPGNIMLGRYGETLVVDWGLAKPFARVEEARRAGEETLRPDGDDDASATRLGQAVGTPAYMSPEQAAGRWDVVGPASDLYSLGATLYALLTGQSPFPTGKVGDIMLKVQRGAFAPPRQVKPSIPRPLEAVCLKAMALEPAARYGSALDLAADLEHWLAGEPVTAWPEPWPLRARRWLGRHRTLVAGTAAAVVVAALSLGVATWRLKVARDGEHKAREVAQQREQEAAEERDRAQANFRTALAAVDEMLTEVGQERLKNIPEMEPVRRALLEKALAFYQRFLRDQGDDPAVRREAGRAFQRVGFINTLLGRHAEAVQAYRQALVLHGGLAEVFPGAPEYRDDLAVSHHDLARLYHETGRLDEAEASFIKARDLYEHLAGAYPDQSNYRAKWALTCQNLGWLYAESAKIQQAEAPYRKALELLETLTQEQPDVPAYQRELASVQSDLGLLSKRLGRVVEAEEAFRLALPRQERLVAEFPADARYQVDLARTQQNLGRLLEDTGRPGPAEKLYRQALTVREQLVRNHPDVPEYQHELALAHYGLAWLYQRTGRLPPAEEALQAALARQEKLARDHPEVPKYRSHLAWSHNDLGIVYGALGQIARQEAAFQRARGLREELARAHPTVPDYQDALAASYTNLANLYGRTSRTAQAEKAYLQVIQVRRVLAEAFPGVPKYRDWLGRSHYNLGIFYRDTNRPAQAEASYRRSIDLGEGLVRDNPTVPEYRLHLAESYNMLASLYASTRRTKEAEAPRQKALALLEQLTREQPDVAAYAIELGGNYCNMGQLVAQTQGGHAALEWYARAVGALEALLRRDPGNATARRYLLITLNSQGYAYKLLGRKDQAEETFRRLLRMDEELVRDRPGDVRQAVHLGASYCNFGNRLAENNKGQDAVAAYTRAVELLEGVLQKDARNGVARRFLCITLHQRGITRSRQMGRHAEALQDLDRALRVGTGDDRALARAKKASVLARLGHHGEAVLEAQAALEAGKPTDEILYVAGVTHALAAAAVRQDGKLARAERERRAEEHAARAVELLDRVRQAGYFKDPGPRADFKADQELAPLRGREDFRKLLAALPTGE